MCSSGCWPSWARPTRRWRHGWRACWCCPGLLTGSPPRGSRRCSSGSRPAPRRRLPRRRARQRGLAMHLAGRPVDEAAAPLERALARAGPRAENSTTRGTLLWTLVTCERFDAVEAALGPMLAEAHRSGSASGLVNTYTILGLLKLRLGALPEADAAARVAVRVAREGDFAPGISTMILADVAAEAGELEEAQALLALLPPGGWLTGLAAAQILATRGRLRLAQGRAAEALADFQA